MIYSPNLVSVAMANLLAGCGQDVIRFNESPADVDSIDEVGSIRVRPVSVDSWDSYVDELSPKFGLTEKEVLAVVISDTRLLEERSLNAIRAVLKAALPTSTKTTVIESIVDGGESNSKETLEKREAAGDINSAPASSGAEWNLLKRSRRLG